LNVFTDEKNQAMRSDGVPWQGAREKHHVFFSSFSLLSPTRMMLPLFALGGSIIACRSLELHIVALESDPIIFNALLLPMRDPQPAHTSRSVAPPSTSIFDPPKKVTKRAFGVICA
jgi:hypothetical protein